MRQTDVKNAIKRAFDPPLPLLFALIPLSVVLLVYGLSAAFHGTALAYLSYVVSSYTLIVSVRRFVLFIRAVRTGFWDYPLIRRIDAHPFGHLLLTDLSFRATTSIYQGLAVNTLYALFRGVTACLYRSVWFAAIAVYYLFLGVIRLALVLHVRRLEAIQEPDVRMLFEFRGYRLCGFLMLLLNTGMSGMVILMVRDDMHYVYPGYIIYLSAAYTFYTAITAAVNIVKFRRLQSPILSASKALALTGAMMSVMALQTAMIAQFGGDDSLFRRSANSLTGGFVCLGSLVIALYMICRGTRCIQKAKECSSNE